MPYKGKGYCLGPGYYLEGPMVLDFMDKSKAFTFYVREDKERTTDENERRRENGISLTIDQMRDLFSQPWLRKRLGLE
jgi:hypothetical protein